LVQGAAEEILTRGWMLPTLAVRYRPWVGVLISSLFFAVMHGLNPNLSFLALLNLFLYGLFAALYALREESLWGICAFHSIWNWAQGNLFGLAVSGQPVSGGMLFNLMETGPDWLTGGAFGPEGGLVTTIVLVISMAIIWWWPTVDTRLRVQEPITVKR
ncbi:MAG: CPBP family intramembrane metalloprotease, partial [Chloroflexi bacterium]